MGGNISHIAASYQGLATHAVSTNHWLCRRGKKQGFKPTASTATSLQTWCSPLCQTGKLKNAHLISFSAVKS